MKTLRKGFSQKLDPLTTTFVSSSIDDKALIEVDIKGSIAHANMLAACGIIESSTAFEICQGLTAIESDLKNGDGLDPEHEDIHMNVEARLLEQIGSAAHSLHTARSRNDQVALDLRLFVVECANETLSGIRSLKTAIVDCAEANIDVVMPGYTHLQRAQPILFSHAIMAFYEQLSRDQERLEQTAARASVSPLGAAAFAGTSLPVDPSMTAKSLALAGVFCNSIDAVSDRDFIADFLYSCTMASIHLSQIAETLIIWMSSEFRFIRLPDSLTTASSLMPQKKNPDVLELVRSKPGLFLGDLVNVITVLKALPQGYNRDLQDTKPPIENCCTILAQALSVMSKVFSSLEVNKANTHRAASDPDLFATDIVEYLVKKGMPFRKAHELISVLAKQETSADRPLASLTLEEWKEIAPEFEADVLQLFSPDKSVNNRTSPGGTARAQVIKAIKRARASLH